MGSPSIAGHVGSPSIAWQPYDMLGIEAKVLCYKLHIDKNFKPIKQKPVIAVQKRQGRLKRRFKNC